jgi:ubiquinone/menaquinone biosynthesis C-methylase UbiE
MTPEAAAPDQHKVRAIDLHTETAGEFEQRYHALAEDPYRSTFTYGRKKIEELIDRELAGWPAGRRALDVGCGTGFNVSRLMARGFDVSGVEPAPGMRARAEAANPGAKILDGDAENLPFPDASFDLVISIEVIRYLKTPDRALSEMARVLKPGGLAIVTAAPKLSLNGYALINTVTSRVKVPTFTRVKHSFMTTRDAEQAALRAGFSRADVHGVFLGPWHGLGRFAPKALALALRALEPIDDRLSDKPPLRDLANHIVLVARR